MNGRFSLVIILLFSHAFAHAETDNITTAAEPAIIPDTSQKIDLNTPIEAPEPVAPKGNSLDKLIELINNNDMHAAYLLGLEMQEEWEGDEKFDFNFGFAAAQTGHYNQAIFSFERLLQSHSKKLRFPLQPAL